MSAKSDVQAIYRQWLDRVPSQAEVDYWVRLMDRGESRERIQQMMLATPEGQEKTTARITEWYEENVGRAPDRGGLEFWLREARKGITFDRLEDRFLDAAEPEMRRLAAREAQKPILDEPPPITTAPPTPTPVTDFDDVEPDYSTLRMILKRYGMDESYDTLVGLISNNASPSEIELTVRTSDAFAERFPQIIARENSGETPISPAQVISYEAHLEQTFSTMGVPSDFGDPRELAVTLMNNDVSMNQVTERLLAYRTFAREVMDDPNQDREAVEALVGKGATLYDIASYALGDETVERITRRLEAASISNTAAQADYRITADEALEQARLGLSMEQATKGFQSLAAQSQIIDQFGQDPDLVSREEELSYARGEVMGQQAVEKARRARINSFREGGGFATDDEGFSGLR